MTKNKFLQEIKPYLTLYYDQVLIDEPIQIYKYLFYASMNKMYDLENNQHYWKTSYMRQIKLMIIKNGRNEKYHSASAVLAYITSENLSRQKIFEQIKKEAAYLKLLHS